MLEIVKDRGSRDKGFEFHVEAAIRISDRSAKPELRHRSYLLPTPAKVAPNPSIDVPNPNVQNSAGASLRIVERNDKELILIIER